jgi:hypothetical protein
LIRTLRDLAALTERDASRIPLLADGTLLRSPGLTGQDSERLRAALPGLPEDYLAIAARFDLAPVAIAYFNLAPGAQGGLTDLVTRLVLANDPTRNRYCELMRPARSLEVAGYGGDPLCMAAVDAPRPGEVVRVDTFDLRAPTLHRTANSFEQLMVGAGRIRERWIEGERGPAAVEAVVGSLASDYGLDEEQLEDWRWFAEVALGD